jgi:hypothetical protein
MVRLVQTMRLSCTDTNTVSKQKERFHLTHVTYEFHRVHPKRFSSLWYIRRKPCTYLASRLALSLNGLSFHLSLVILEYHWMCPKWFSEPMIRLAQTVHLSCIDTNTVSKWKELRFIMTHVTLGLHLVHRKWFSDSWYVWCKPCIFLASRLALSPNGLKWASTWAPSPSGTIECVHNNF